MTTEISSKSNPTSGTNYDVYSQELTKFIPRTTFPPSEIPFIPDLNKNETAILDDSDDEDELAYMDHQRSLSHSKTKNHHTLLSTQSPLGIAAASLITPTRMAKLLIETGPLPIRHITKHLSLQIPDFALLSLSKQRRLIMSALEMGDEETGCIFEKVGWGQWATKQIGAEEVVAYNQSRPPPQLQHTTSHSSSPPTRRQSITNPLHDPHNIKVPYNPTSLDEAVLESSSSINSSDDEDDEIGIEDDDGGIFKLENTSNSNLHSNEVRFSSRVLNSVTQQQQSLPQPLKKTSQQRRGSSSHGIRKPRVSKSRLNSFDYYEAKTKFDGNSIEGVLDLALVPDSIIIRKKPRSSFSESFLRSTPTPSLKISSDEHLPLSSSSPPAELEKALAQPDTDEEDWQSIGADKLSAAYTLLMIKKED